jgi:hypothetical protein
MKKYSLMIIALVISTSIFASKGDSEKIYKTIKEGTDAFSLSLSKDMIDFFDMDIDFNGKEKWITGDFAEGRMTIIKEDFNCSDIKKMFAHEGFELIDLEDQEKIEIEGDEVYLYVSRIGNNANEAHFIIQGEEKVVLFSIYGDMKVSTK